MGYATLTLNDGWQAITVLDNPAGIYKSLAVLRHDSTGRAAIAMWQSVAGDDTVRLLRPLPFTGPEELINLGLNVTAAPGDVVRISYTTAEPGSYQLQWSRDLRVWYNVGEAIDAGGTLMQVDELDPSALEQRYYRVRYSGL